MPPSNGAFNTLAGLALAVAGAPAAAVQVARVDFVGSSTTCVWWCNTAAVSFSASFTVPDSALTADGSVDILLTLDTDRLRQYDHVPSARQTRRALARVAHGAVVDVDLQYDGSYYESSGNYSRYETVGFRALAGSWNQGLEYTTTVFTDTGYLSINGGTVSQSGTYLITTVVPEPAAWLLWLAGAVALPWVRRGGRSPCRTAESRGPAACPA